MESPGQVRADYEAWRDGQGTWMEVRDMVGMTEECVRERGDDVAFFGLISVTPIGADRYAVVGTYMESDRPWTAIYGGSEELLVAVPLDV